MGLFAWSFADFLRMFNSRLALKRVALPKPHKGTIKFKNKPFNPVDSAYVSVHLLVQMMLYTVLLGFSFFGDIGLGLCAAHAKIFGSKAGGGILIRRRCDSETLEESGWDLSRNEVSY